MLNTNLKPPVCNSLTENAKNSFNVNYFSFVFIPSAPQANVTSLLPPISFGRPFSIEEPIDHQVKNNTSKTLRFVLNVDLRSCNYSLGSNIEIRAE